jgi:catechol 2,3-dioxygenase-like lactoylglutathione lyase family enzyme
MTDVRIVGFEPFFSVRNVERAVHHYQQLGFTTSYHDESYAFAHRDELTIHLGHADEPSAHTPSVLYIHVDDAERLATDWREAGMEVVGPDDYDYGKREGSHVDPDGNLIRFGSPLPR